MHENANQGVCAFGVFVAVEWLHQRFPLFHQGFELFGDFLLAVVELDQLMRVGVVGFVGQLLINLGIFAFKKMNLFFYFFKVTLTLSFACLFFFLFFLFISAGRNFGCVGDRGSGGSGGQSVAISSVGAIAGIRLAAGCP